MAITAYDTGNGTTLTLATTGAVGNVTKLSFENFSIGTVDISYLSTSGDAECIPADLREPGGGTAEVQFDSSKALPVPGANVETITVTLAKPAGAATNATWAGTGFITSVKLPDIVNNQLLMGTITWKWNGITGPTFTVAT